MSTLGKILGGVGYVLDTPGSLLRGGIANTADVLRGEDRFRGFRASGRQMLDSMGVGGGYGAGLAADLLVDPLNVLGGAALFKNAGKLAKGVSSGASTLGAALRPSKSTAMALGAPTAGFGVLALNEDQDPGMSLLGTALMMSPLAFGMAKGIGKLTAGKAVGKANPFAVATETPPAVLHHGTRSTGAVTGGTGDSLGSQGVWLSEHGENAMEFAKYRTELGEPRVVSYKPQFKKTARISNDTAMHTTADELRSQGFDSAYIIDTGYWVALTPDVLQSRAVKGKLAAGKAVQQVSAPGGFRSRLEEALANAPDEFVSTKEVVREKKIPGRVITNPKTGEVIKEIPEQIKRDVMPARTAEEQLSGYLGERAHPQEVEWVLGKRFQGAERITKQELLQAFREGKIDLEVLRSGGNPIPMEGDFAWKAGSFEKGGKHSKPWHVTHASSREDAIELAKFLAAESSLEEGRKFVGKIKQLTKPEHGNLAFPDMLISGGKNATEVPIRLGKPVSYSVEQTGKGRWNVLANGEQVGAVMAASADDALRGVAVARRSNSGAKGARFPDERGHFGDDIVAWTVHDQRKMPDGKTATFIQEIQSDWHQTGAKTGYSKPHQKAWEVFDSKTGETKGWFDSESQAKGALSAGLDYDGPYAGRGGVADAPFKGNEWMKLGLRQAIGDAIKRGDDYVMLAAPKLVHRTQSMPILKARKLYGEIIPNLANEMLAQYGAKMEMMLLPGRKKQQVLGFRIPDAMKAEFTQRGFPLMSMLPWLAAGGGATGSALAHALGQQQETY